MSRNSFVVASDALVRLSQRLADKPKQLERARARVIGTLRRRLPVIAGRLAVETVLNVRPSAIRGLLSVKSRGDSALVLTGIDKRIPLNAFIGTRWGGPTSPGVTVQKWKDAPAEVYDAARARSKGGLAVGGAFFVKGRGLRGGVWQRLDKITRTATGRIRQVATPRTGPSFATALADGKHGDIIPRLAEEARGILGAEVARLTKGL
jgi:hypothetical protein